MPWAMSSAAAEAVVHGGDADARGVDPAQGLARGGHALRDGGVAGHAELLSSGGEGGGIGIDNGGELDGIAGALELAIDAEMISPECASADDGDAQQAVIQRKHYLPAGASTAWRQRP